MANVIIFKDALENLMLNKRIPVEVRVKASHKKSDIIDFERASLKLTPSVKKPRASKKKCCDMGKYCECGKVKRG